MIKLNKNTKKAQGFIRSYNRAKARNLFEAYRGPVSQAKYESFNEIEYRASRQGGIDLRVISFGCQFYSTGYILNKDLIIDTARYTYIIPNVF